MIGGVITDPGPRQVTAGLRDQGPGHDHRALALAGPPAADGCGATNSGDYTASKVVAGASTSMAVSRPMPTRIGTGRPGGGLSSLATLAASSPSTAAPVAASAPAGATPPPETPTRSSAVASSLAGRRLRARSSASISTSSATSALAARAVADQRNAR